MKKRIALLGTVLAFVFAFCGCIPERVTTPDGFELAYFATPFSKLRLSDYDVLRYVGEEVEITIPLEYNGVPIVGLGCDLGHMTLMISETVKK